MDIAFNINVGGEDCHRNLIQPLYQTLLIPCYWLQWGSWISPLMVHWVILKILPLLQLILPIIFSSLEGKPPNFGLFTNCMIPLIILVSRMVIIAFFAMQICPPRDAPQLVSLNTCSTSTAKSMRKWIRGAPATWGLTQNSNHQLQVYSQGRPRRRVSRILRWSSIVMQLPISSLPSRTLLLLLHHWSSAICFDLFTRTQTKSQMWCHTKYKNKSLVLGHLLRGLQIGSQSTKRIVDHQPLNGLRWCNVRHNYFSLHQEMVPA